MKILTLNTWQERGPWQKRWQGIETELERLHPDIIGFQEVFNKDWAKQVQNRLGYPEISVGHPESGLVILSRFPVVRTACKTFETQSHTEDYRRYGLGVLLESPHGQIGLFSTHLSWRMSESSTRARQIHELMRWCVSFSQSQPFFVVGDFNAPPYSLEMAPLRNSGAWKDVYALKHPENEGITWDNRNPFTAGASHPMPDRRIDYLWAYGVANLETKIKSCDLAMNQPDPEGIYPSDHFAVWAELYL